MVVKLAKLGENRVVGLMDLQHARLENPTFFLLNRRRLGIWVFY